MRKTQSKKNRKNKKKSKLKTWEIIFILSSITIMFTILGIYAHRATFYYKKLNYIEPDSKLLDVLINDNNIVYTGDGLYKKDDNTYYYSGVNTNNYLFYKGRMWRIIGIDSIGIKLITDDNQTVLVWGNNTNYENSIIKKWMTDKFINTLDDSESLVATKWCNAGIDINEYNCNEEIEDVVGLITTEEYLKAGGVNSYLNTGTYFWTLNTSADNKAYYVHNAGGINNEVGTSNSLYSYGVRPVVYLGNEIKYYKGNGTKENPYMTELNKDTKINNHDIGSYIKYLEYDFRIIEKKEEYTKLILDGYILDDNNEGIKLSYDKIDNYLNKTFIEKLNKDDLVETKYNQIEFNYKANYNYNNIKSSQKKYIWIPTIGDLFIPSYSDTWLYANRENNLIYKTTNGSIMADFKDSENYIRPIIAVKNDLIISAGEGTKENPYLVEGNL